MLSIACLPAASDVCAGAGRRSQSRCRASSIPSPKETRCFSFPPVTIRSSSSCQRMLFCVSAAHARSVFRPHSMAACETSGRARIPSIFGASLIRRCDALSSLHHPSPPHASLSLISLWTSSPHTDVQSGQEVLTDSNLGRSQPRWVPFGAGRHRCIGFEFAQIQIRCIWYPFFFFFFSVFDSLGAYLFR